VSLVRREHWIILTLVVVWGSSLCAQGGIGRQRRNWGEEWKSHNLQSHMLYVGGLQEGSYRMSVLGGVLTGQLPPQGASANRKVDSLALTPLQKRLIDEIAEDQYRAVDIERFGTEAVSRVVSDLYRDPSNTFIPWSDMVGVALMRLAGVPENEVASELSILRQVVAR
jgi:hypothetical protein